MLECDEMYKLVCKDEFAEIRKSLKSIDDKLSGNPSGIIPRLAVVEDQTKANTSRWKQLFLAVIALTTAIIAKFIHSLFG